MKLQTLKNFRKPLAAVTATLLAVSAAHADTESGKLTLAGFTDGAQGTELLAGNYNAVITALTSHAYAYQADEVAASTNLCVAFVATGRLDEAHDACDQAITMARLDSSGVTLAERMAHDNAVAIAIANRAVLTKLSGE